MKKIIIVFAVVITIAACKNKEEATVVATKNKEERMAEHFLIDKQ